MESQELTSKQLADGCRHFNGIQYTHCKAGVCYAEVRDDSSGKRQWPCKDFAGRGYIDTCKKREFKSESEIDQEKADLNAFLAAYFERLHDFTVGKIHVCPECGQKVTSAKIYKKIEPEVFSLYVKPCGCRLGLWSKVPDWITEVEVVESEY